MGLTMCLAGERYLQGTWEKGARALAPSSGCSELGAVPKAATSRFSCHTGGEKQ